MDGALFFTICLVNSKLSFMIQVVIRNRHVNFFSLFIMYLNVVGFMFDLDVIEFMFFLGKPAR